MFPEESSLGVERIATIGRQRGGNHWGQRLDDESEAFACLALFLGVWGLVGDEFEYVLGEEDGQDRKLPVLIVFTSLEGNVTGLRRPTRNPYVRRLE
jgi:hypothetical protein